MEDGFLENALGQMPKVHVGKRFLPSVMSKVYAHHARANLKPKYIFGGAVIFLVASLTFFVLDVREFQAEMNLSSFSDAYLQKLTLMLSQIDGSFTDVTGLLVACWQLLTGVLGKAIEPENLPFLGLVLVLLAGISFGIRKWALSLYRREGDSK